jgi:endonuclease/exonuclease/phosphatase family metal-dependent hydrolase
MKKHFVSLCLVFIVGQLSAQEMSFMTYNIRYANVNDGDNQWEKRKEYLSDQIRFYAPDVIGIQEGLELQVNFLNARLSDYKFFGVGRNDGKNKGEYCAIFYKRNKFDVLKQDTFWLSEHPEQISVGWDAAMERICTYGLFLNKKTGKKFWVFNTHFDHIGMVAREKSAVLIAQKIREINKGNFPVILMGDFNLNDQSKAITYLSGEFNDSRMVSMSRPFGPFGTFTGFAFQEPVKDRIDYIFCSKEDTMVKKYAVLTDSRDQKYPSDHFPVFIQVEFNEDRR